MASGAALEEHARRHLASVLNKIPMFQDVTLAQAERLLGISRLRETAAGEVLCAEGSPPSEMYVLLTGELSVVRDGAEVAALKPVVPVGEMGVVTGDARTASIVSKVPSRFLAIRKAEFDLLLRHEMDLGFTIYRSLARTLSDRVASTTAQFEQLQRENSNLKRQLAQRETDTESR